MHCYIYISIVPAYSHRSKWGL